MEANRSANVKILKSRKARVPATDNPNIAAPTTDSARTVSVIVGSSTATINK